MDRMKREDRRPEPRARLAQPAQHLHDKKRIQQVQRYIDNVARRGPVPPDQTFQPERGICQWKILLRAATGPNFPQFSDGTELRVSSNIRPVRPDVIAL